jgi:hypothetical protein
MGKGSAQEHAPTKRRRKAPSLTFTHWNKSTEETTVLPLQPDTHFTFSGREHRLLISINKQGEPLLRFRHKDHDRMLIISQADETFVMLSDLHGNDAGHFKVKHTGEVECTVCQTKRHIEPVVELMTDTAIVDTLTAGVGKFVTATDRSTTTCPEFLDVPLQALTALVRKIQKG